MCHLFQNQAQQMKIIRILRIDSSLKIFYQDIEN